MQNSALSQNNKWFPVVSAKAVSESYDFKQQSELFLVSKNQILIFLDFWVTAEKAVYNVKPKDIKDFNRTVED